MSRVRAALSRVGVLPAFLLAAFLGALFAATVCDFSVEYRDRGFCWDVDVGESVLHGLNSGNEGATWWGMPAGATANALLCNHAPAAASIAALLLLSASYPLLVFLLGVELHSPAAGLLGALASLGVLWVLPDETTALQFGIAVSAVAVVALWRAGRPDRDRTLALAAAAGTAALVRSPIFFFPLLLLAGEALAAKPEARRESWRLLAASAALLFAFLIPWAVAGKWMNGSWNLFEWGWPRPGSGPLPVYAPHVTERFVMDDGAGGIHSVYAWALRESLQRPFGYPLAVLGRVLAAVRMLPWLFAAAAAAVWFRRRDPGFRTLGVLALTLLVVENLVETREVHMVACWPPLLALAAAGALEGLGVARARPGSALPIRFAAAALLPFACLVLLSGAALLRYPDRGTGPDPVVVTRAIGEFPEDPYLRSLRGRVLLRGGKPGEAGHDFSAALLRQPSKRRELDYAVALAVKGGKAAGLVDKVRLDRLPTRLGDHWERIAALKSLACLFHGDVPAARRAANAGGLLQASTDPDPPEVHKFGELYTMLRTCGTLPEFWPPQQRLDLFERLAGWDRPDPEFLRYMADTAQAAGRTKEAESLRRRAERP